MRITLDFPRTKGDATRCRSDKGAYVWLYSFSGIAMVTSGFLPSLEPSKSSKLRIGDTIDFDLNMLITSGKNTEQATILSDLLTKEEGSIGAPSRFCDTLTILSYNQANI